MRDRQARNLRLGDSYDPELAADLDEFIPEAAARVVAAREEATLKRGLKVLRS